MLCKPAAAQLTAGGVPPGGTVLQTNINLALSIPNTSDSASLEVDCDDFPDAWVVLHRDMPEVDGTNWAALHFVDDDIEMCVDPAPGFTQRPKYHVFGAPLDCSGNFDWQAASGLYLGDYGGFVMTGPFVIDSQYVAYRRNGQVGWIKLSFQLDASTIFLEVHELLPLCPITAGMAEHANVDGISLFPNPGIGDMIHVQGMDAMDRIEVHDATGRMLAQYEGAMKSVPAPKAAGLYLIRATHSGGQRSSIRWLRQ